LVFKVQLAKTDQLIDGGFLETQDLSSARSTVKGRSRGGGLLSEERAKERRAEARNILVLHPTYMEYSTISTSKYPTISSSKPLEATSPEMSDLV
jgi:hypothetical protein